MTHTDIKENSFWRRLPGMLSPYALLIRLDRPIGTWLLLLPALWAITLAAGGLNALDPHILSIIALFSVGAVLMRGAGCVINDLWDIKFDRQVERTRQRPLASGALRPWQAVALLLALLLCGLVILFQFSLVTILLGFLAMPLIVIYPLMKRVTWWPQAFLGVTFNLGALMGWGAVTDVIEPAALCLYAAGIFWTLGYDTVYAHQDKEDDALIGVRSSARKLGDKSKIWVAGFYALAIIMLLLAGVFAHASWLYFAFLLLGAIFLGWQTRGWNMDDPADCLKRFKSSRDFGLIILAGCFLSGF